MFLVITETILDKQDLQNKLEICVKQSNPSLTVLRSVSLSPVFLLR